MKTPKLSMKKIKTLTSKTGVKMVIAQDETGYAVFTADEYSQGKNFRYPEYDGIDNLDEAISQAKHF